MVQCTWYLSHNPWVITASLTRWCIYSLFEDVYYWELCFFLWLLITGSINSVQWIYRVCHTWYINTTYNCKKFKRNIYLVFRAAFSRWSRVLISLYCSAGCHVIPFHQDSQVHCLNKIIFMEINLTCLLCAPVHYTSQLHKQSEMHTWWTPHMKKLRLNHSVLHPPLVSGQLP